MSLFELEKEWRHRLSQADGPPILGLAPLSNEAFEKIGEQAKATLAKVKPLMRLGALRDLLHRYPATSSLWLARHAGEAWDGDKFYEPFSSRIGVELPSRERENFIAAFRKACRTSLPHGVPSSSCMARRHLGELLFQAGLPCCHGETFADSLLVLSKTTGGLPNPEDPDELEDFLEVLLQRAEVQARPTLAQALRGAVGKLVLAAAIKAVESRDFQGINPVLGDRLARRFADASSVRRGAAVRRPYLRLREGGVGLEVVGPPQEDARTGGRTITWVVNGKRHRWAPGDEFVIELPTDEQVEIQLEGGLGCASVRTMNLKVGTKEQPILIFEASSRRRKAASAVGTDEPVWLPCADYWVVHPVAWELTEATDQWPWSDGRRITSVLRLRPGMRAVLKDADGGEQARIEPALLPFAESLGTRLLTADGQPIYFGWTSLPQIWVPALKDEDGIRWTVRFTAGTQECESELAWDSAIGLGELRRCQAVASTLLQDLEPGLHEVVCEIRRGLRRSTQQRFWFWQGLVATDPAGFTCSQRPMNLRSDDCRGFELDAETIRHKSDSHLRRHTLVFEVGDTVQSLSWTPPHAVFLESVHRTPGQPSTVKPEPLKQTFPALLTSILWLRVHIAAGGTAELRVNGQPLQPLRPGGDGLTGEISLASLAATHPTGGSLTLLWAGNEFGIARFHRPVVPTKLNFVADEGYKSLVVTFIEQVDWVQPVVRDLVSNREHSWAGRTFDTSGHCIFSSEGIPTIDCSNLPPKWAGDASHYHVSVNVPVIGWPEGIWLIELKSRQDDSGDCQFIVDERGGRAPILILQAPASLPKSFRAQVLWWAFGGGLAATSVPGQPPESIGNGLELTELIGELQRRLACGCVDVAWNQLRPLETLARELARQAGRQLALGSKSLAKRLLEEAAEDHHTSRSLFAAIPRLLALPAEAYLEQGGDGALPRGLRWCGEIAVAPRLFDAFFPLIEGAFSAPQQPEPGIVTTLRHCANFIPVISSPPGKGSKDFARLNLTSYFKMVSKVGLDSDTEEWGAVDALGLVQIGVGLARLHQRRERGEGQQAIGQAHAIFRQADPLRRWLREKLGVRLPGLKESDWTGPWLDLTLSGDAFTPALVQFASMFALGARGAAREWFPFDDLLRKVGTLVSDQGPPAAMSARAMTTLVAIAPELLAYHLMLWEFVLRTEANHD